mgnify:CR=1 FL=1
MNHYNDGVANCFITDIKRKLATEGLGLQDVKRSVNEIVLAPPQFFVGVVDELVRHNTECDEHDGKNVRRSKNCFTPGCFAICWATHTDNDDRTN